MVAAWEKTDDRIWHHNDVSVCLYPIAEVRPKFPDWD
jgi:hypothetical protein